MEVILYNNGLLRLTNGALVFATAPMYAVLLNNTYVPALTHTTYADVSAAEIADPDYVAQDLTTKTVVLNGTAVEFDSDDILFGDPVTISAQFIVFLEGDAATKVAGDILWGYADFGSMLSSTAAQFTIRTTNKLYQIAPAP